MMMEFKGSGDATPRRSLQTKTGPRQPQGLRKWLARTLAATSFAAISVAAFAKDSRPNVLLIGIDDLNDWTGSLGGHPQAYTPNIDRFANSGTLFANAHCQSPVCMPSRASMMTSRYPSSTGLYFLFPQNHDESPQLEGVLTMPERFAQEGYEVMGAGKLFHNRENDHVFGSVGEYGGNFGTFGPYPEKQMVYDAPPKLWDWGVYPKNDDDSETPDYQIAQWAKDKLEQDYDKPFFLAAGFYRPHVPMYATQKWFDRFPLEEIQLPLVKDGDWDDLPDYAIDLTNLEHISPTQEWMLEHGQWEHAVQSYLASIAFVDSCVGIVLDALENSPHKSNTIVVVFSDHGFHMGEKKHWAKRTLWEDGTRVLMAISGPGLGAQQRSTKPVGLIDIYPTLLELCGMKADKGHEGHSMSPLIDNPRTDDWSRPTLTNFGKGNNAVRSEYWRYIRYLDGSEELYDHRWDPHEWANLASNPAFNDVKASLAKWLPEREAPILGDGSTGHKAYKASAERLKERMGKN